jgi:hypothetical protein
LEAIQSSKCQCQPKILQGVETQQAATLNPDSGLPQNLPFLVLEVLNL